LLKVGNEVGNLLTSVYITILQDEIQFLPLLK
jgi:hypothetical protein